MKYLWNMICYSSSKVEVEKCMIEKFIYGNSFKIHIRYSQYSMGVCVIPYRFLEIGKKILLYYVMFSGRYIYESNFVAGHDVWNIK